MQTKRMRYHLVSTLLALVTTAAFALLELRYATSRAWVVYGVVVAIIATVVARYPRAPVQG